MYTQGDLAAAEPLCREALDARRATIGDRHPHTLNSIGNLGELLEARGDLTGAESLLREALKGRRETLGNHHPHTHISIHSLDRLLYAKANDKLPTREE